VTLKKALKKMASPRLAIFQKTVKKRQTRLMAAATAAATGGPQVEEIQPLDFHESPVNQEVISEHDDQRDYEMGDGFRG
jgi:hypothetical protein